jgi:hypothetical protein
VRLVHVSRVLGQRNHTITSEYPLKSYTTFFRCKMNSCEVLVGVVQCGALFCGSVCDFLRSLCGFLSTVSAVYSRRVSRFWTLLHSLRRKDPIFLHSYLYYTCLDILKWCPVFLVVHAFLFPQSLRILSTVIRVLAILRRNYLGFLHKYLFNIYEKRLQ